MKYHSALKTEGDSDTDYNMLSEIRSQLQKDYMILLIRDLKLNPIFTIFSLYDSKKIKLSIPSSSYP